MRKLVNVALSLVALLVATPRPGVATCEYDDCEGSGTVVGYSSYCDSSCGPCNKGYSCCAVWIRQSDGVICEDASCCGTAVRKLSEGGER